MMRIQIILGNATLLHGFPQSVIFYHETHLISIDFLKSVIIGKVLHDIFHPAFKDVAQAVDGIHFYVFVMTQSVKEGSCDVVMGVEVVLGDSTFFHRFPKFIIFYHEIHLSPIDFPIL